jgi:hypothetical protein
MGTRTWIIVRFQKSELTYKGADHGVDFGALILELGNWNEETSDQ